MCVLVLLTLMGLSGSPRPFEFRLGNGRSPTQASSYKISQSLPAGFQLDHTVSFSQSFKEGHHLFSAMLSTRIHRCTSSISLVGSTFIPAHFPPQMLKSRMTPAVNIGI